MTGELQTVDSTTGDASGSAYGGSVVSAGKNITAAGAFEFALATPASATQGDLIAAVFKISSGTVSSVTFNTSSKTGMFFPYAAVKTPTLGKANNAGPMFMLKYSSGYVPVEGCDPSVETYATVNYNSGTNPNRRALKMTMPFDCTVNGICYDQGLNADTQFVLYDSTNTVLGTIALDKDNFCQSGGVGMGKAYFSSNISLSKGGVYRLSLEPTTVTNMNCIEIVFAGSYAGANPIESMPAGLNAVLSTWGGSSWTDVTTRRPMHSLLISQIGDSASGGSTFINRGIRSGGGL